MTFAKQQITVFLGFFEISEYTYKNTPFHNLHTDKDGAGVQKYDYFDDEEDEDDDDDDDIPGKL